MNKCRLRIARTEYDALLAHLFPGDRDEHGAVALASMLNDGGIITLCVREVHIAKEGIDYVEGRVGYRALTPTFIHRLITRARDLRLVYLAIHNHGSDLEVGFSSIDFASHQRGYPALLQIAKGMPVGALVFGRRSIQADLWLPGGNRLELDFATIVGNTIQRIRPSKQLLRTAAQSSYDRQIRMFGSIGQTELASAKVAVIGLGGIGSLVSEYLARLGVGHLYLVDDDHVEDSNLSRIVGASMSDVANNSLKVEVAKRVAVQSNKDIAVTLLPADVAKESVAKALTSCDYLFLCADSMRARLVFNALVHQYLIPGAQLGSKIRADASGTIIDIFSANRPVRPGNGCLWCNQLIDPGLLAIEAKTDEDRKSQAYGTQEPNPSVISLNAISAAHAVNDFLLDFLSLRAERSHFYEHFSHLSGKQNLVVPRQDGDCPECSRGGLRFAQADLVDLPCVEG